MTENEVKIGSSANLVKFILKCDIMFMGDEEWDLK
jgi:hypothetical protein